VALEGEEMRRNQGKERRKEGPTLVAKPTNRQRRGGTLSLTKEKRQDKDSNAYHGGFPVEKKRTPFFPEEGKKRGREN